MGSSNIQIWNPPQNNQESDADYTTDTQRALGATTPSIFPAATGNKLFNNLSVPIAQFCAALAAKGYTCLDSDAANMLVAMKAIVTAFDMGIIPVAFSASPPSSFDCSAALCPRFSITLSADIAPVVINPFVGQEVTFLIKQDGSGNHAWTWPVAFLGAGAIDPTASATSIQKFLWDGTHWRPTTAMTSS